MIEVGPLAGDSPCRLTEIWPKRTECVFFLIHQENYPADTGDNLTYHFILLYCFLDNKINVKKVQSCKKKKKKKKNEVKKNPPKPKSINNSIFCLKDV